MPKLTDALTGDLRSSLAALRDRLAAELDEGSTCQKCGGSIASPTAPIAKQLRDVLMQIDSMAKPEGSKTDELKRKRAQREAGVAHRAATGDKRG